MNLNIYVKTSKANIAFVFSRFMFSIICTSFFILFFTLIHETFHRECIKHA